MAECLAAWTCLIVAAVNENPLWAIASGLFAIAVRIDLCRTKGRADNG